MIRIINVVLLMPLETITIPHPPSMRTVSEGEPS